MSDENKATPPLDVGIENTGSMMRFVLNTDKAAEWVEENVPLESWAKLGYRCFAVDLRFAPDLVHGMQEAGLTVGDV
jgi:hypothetical protein